jgi:hypothetical protein
VNIPTGSVVTGFRVEGAVVPFTAGEGYIEPALQYVGKKFQADVEAGTEGASGIDPKVASAVVGAAGVGPLRASDVGMRIIGGRMANVVEAATQFTYRMVFEVKQPVRAVSFLLAQGCIDPDDLTPTSTPNIIGRVFACAGLADAEIDAGALSNFAVLTADGSGTIALPAPTVDNTRKCKWTDFVGVTHAPRADGKSGAFVGITALMGTATRLVLLGDGTDTFDNWRTKTDGGAFWLKYRPNAALGNASSSFTVVPNHTPIVGVRYITESGELVTNIAAFGDSIDEGRDTYIGEGALFWASEDIGDVAVEWSNLAWSGSTGASHAIHLTDAFSDGVLPDFAVFPAGSPNDISGTIEYLEAGPWPGRARSMINACREYGVQPIIRTVAPSNNSVKAYGATDSVRVSHNTCFVMGALARSGIPVVDASSAVSGSAHASGQIELAAFASLDGIHLTRAGNSVVGALIRKAFIPLV